MQSTTLKPLVTAYQRQQQRVTMADVREKYGVDTVHRLSQNENPLGPSPKAIEAINRVAPTLALYPDYSDIELREAIAQQIGRGITPDHIYTGCSGYEALELLTRGYLTPDHETIVSTPTFISAYSKTSTLQGAKLVDVPLNPDDFSYNVDAVLEAITPRTKLILLCNPNNPTGTIITARQMQQLMDNIREDIIVVSDQVYHHYVDAEQYPDALRYVLDNRNLVLMHSFSKAYGLAGLRLGYGIARTEIANHLASLHRGFHHSTLTFAAGIAAVNDTEHLAKSVAFAKHEMQWIQAQFDRLGVKYWQTYTNFVLFDAPYETREMTDQFMQAGIMVRPQHKSGLHQQVRVSVGTHEANEAFIKRLEVILEMAES